MLVRPQLNVLIASALVALAAAPAAHARGGWLQHLEENEAFTAPAGERPAQIDRAGTTVIPNGRVINPAGTTVEVAPHPFGLELSPDGKTVATANSGIRPFSVSLVDARGTNPTARQIPPGNAGDSAVINAVFMGLAYAPNGKSLYVSGGNDGTILELDEQTGAKLRTIDLTSRSGAARGATATSATCASRRTVARSTRSTRRTSGSSAPMSPPAR